MLKFEQLNNLPQKNEENNINKSEITGSQEMDNIKTGEIKGNDDQKTEDTNVVVKKVAEEEEEEIIDRHKVDGLRKYDHKYFDSVLRLAEEENKLRDELAKKSVSGELAEWFANLHSDEIYRRIKAEQKGFIDNLTGVYNKTALEHLAPEVVNLNIRDNKDFSVLMLDLDHFKMVNDSYGHPAGDAVLKQVVEIVKKQIQRESDMFFRYGGEEFVIFLPDTNSYGANKIAQKIVEAVERTSLVITQPDGEDIILNKTISVGLVEYSSLPDKPQKGGEILEEMIRKADEALYYVKEHGRNNYLNYEEYLEINKDHLEAG